jgi:valyl-tRNA synthetase
MPFITEEVWQNIQDRKAGESICMASYPKAEAVKDASLVGKAQLAFDTIIQIRNLRSKKGLSPVKDALSLHIKTTDNSEFAPFLAYIQRLANLTDIKFGEEKPAKALSFVVKNYECFVPFEEDEAEAQASKADLQKELDYARGFRESVLKKLSNEKFVANAKPEIIENERKKLADAEAKIVTLEEALKN